MKEKKLIFDKWACLVKHIHPEMSDRLRVEIIFAGKGGSVKSGDIKKILDNELPTDIVDLTIIIRKSHFKYFVVPALTRYKINLLNFRIESSLVEKYSSYALGYPELTLKKSKIIEFKAHRRTICRLFDSIVPFSKKLLVVEYWNNNAIDTAYDIATKKHYFPGQSSRSVEFSEVEGQRTSFLYIYMACCWVYKTDSGSQLAKKYLESLLKGSVFRAKLLATKTAPIIENFVEKRKAILDYYHNKYE